ncbi:MAG: sugar phosphate isomerase/epimerase [Lentisphaeria bacterium]|nr:sugar phosphate isomerase/epimerase [Lentisphaeria bacterium]
MSNIISCRTGMFGSAETAFEFFPKAGVLHAECPPPSEGKYDELAKKADATGMTIATIATQLALDSDEAAKPFYDVIDGTASISVPKIFVSMKAADEVPREEVIARLRNISEYAVERNVVLCMETHPPFGENAAKAKAVITEVGSTGLRYNFDTANVYYYNEGVDTISELETVAPLVAAVHIKDTDGGFKSPNFPPVGTGVVDFPRVFEILGGLGFSGPYTFEIEGALVSGLDPEGRLQFLKDCCNYLRTIGAIDS